MKKLVLIIIWLFFQVVFAFPKFNALWPWIDVDMWSDLKVITGYIIDNNKVVQENRVKESWKEDKKWVIMSRFFDTKQFGFSDNRANGHCTQYAAWYRYENFWITLPRRWNAIQWLPRAKNLGRETGKKPWLWALMISRNQGKWSYAGHVSVVISMREEGRSFLVEEMNYRGTDEVTQRRVESDDPRIEGYIYLPN